MSRMPSYLKVCSVCLVVVVCVTGAFLITRASVDRATPNNENAVPAAISHGGSTLSRQPEALRVSRRLGKRFEPSSRAASVLTGKVSIGGSEQPLTIIRRQSDQGEDVEVRLAGRIVKGDSRENQLLAERLTYDSQDYFVLAQLAGASYYTVSRFVRPDHAPDNYEGPLWTVVRVDDPSLDKETRQASKWRLFYLNSITGLVDKIVSEENGQPIEASFSDWTERGGEKFPATIAWTSHGQILMTLNLTNFSIATH